MGSFRAPNCKPLDQVSEHRDQLPGLDQARHLFHVANWLVPAQTEGLAAVGSARSGWTDTVPEDTTPDANGKPAKHYWQRVDP